MATKNESHIQCVIPGGTFTKHTTTFYCFLSRLRNNEVGSLLESISFRRSFKWICVWIRRYGNLAHLIIVKAELWITLNEAGQIAGCSYRTSKTAMASSISPEETQHFYLCWVTICLLKRLQQWNLFLCLLHCLPCSLQRWKDEVKEQNLFPNNVTHYTLYIVY